VGLGLEKSLKRSRAVGWKLSSALYASKIGLLTDIDDECDRDKAPMAAVLADPTPT
jgi:hypothetical protein